MQLNDFDGIFGIIEDHPGPLEVPKIRRKRNSRSVSNPSGIEIKKEPVEIKQEKEESKENDVHPDVEKPEEKKRKKQKEKKRSTPGRPLREERSSDQDLIIPVSPGSETDPADADRSLEVESIHSAGELNTHVGNSLFIHYFDLFKRIDISLVKY